MPMVDDWAIGLLPQSLLSVVADGVTEQIAWVQPEAGSFLADPCCAMDEAGVLHLWAEKFCRDQNKAHLVYASTTLERFDACHFESLIDLPCHLSYPQVIGWQGAYFLFCESWEAKGVLVFSAVSRAGPWCYAGKLLQGMKVVDPTPYFDGDTWWLFFNLRDDQPNARLRRACAPSPLGPWQVEAEPVVSGLLGGRSAGPLFHLPDGSLIRPGQDCRETYGGGMALFKVEALTINAYKESLIRVLEPQAGSYPFGLHTICAAGPNHCLVDGKRWVRQRYPLLQELVQWTPRAFRRFFAPLRYR